MKQVVQFSVVEKMHRLMLRAKAKEQEGKVELEEPDQVH